MTKEFEDFVVTVENYIKDHLQIELHSKRELIDGRYNINVGVIVKINDKIVTPKVICTTSGFDGISAK